MSSQGRYAELGPIAAALGAPWTGGAETKFAREGFAITVGLRIDSGSVMGVDVEHGLDRREPVDGLGQPRAAQKREQRLGLADHRGLGASRWSRV